MWPMVSFCGSATVTVLSKQSTSILKPLTDESRHKLKPQTTSLYWCYQNATNTSQPQANILQHQITFHQASILYHFNLPLTFLRPPSTKSPKQPPLPTDNLINIIIWPLLRMHALRYWMPLCFETFLPTLRVFSFQFKQSMLWPRY